MSRNNNNNNDNTNDNPSNIRRSNFKSYSRVCYSDPNQQGKMICKEDENINGNRNHKEIIYDTKSNTSNIVNNQSENQNQPGFVPFLKSLFNRSHSQDNDQYANHSQYNRNDRNDSNHNHYPQYNRVFEINHMNNMNNQMGNDFFNHVFSDPFFKNDPIDSIMNNIEKEFFIDFGNFSNGNNHAFNNTFSNGNNNNREYTNERKRPTNYNNIKVYDV